MNHLIVYAHPSTSSFSSAILDEIKECSVKKECKTEVRDLYAIAFDPILKAADFEGLCGGETPEDIKREHSYIEWADLITFIYPIWWASMPAILKGYIDRVFSYELVLEQEKNSKNEEKSSSNQKYTLTKESNSSKKDFDEKSSNSNKQDNDSKQNYSDSKNEENSSKGMLKEKKVLIISTMGTSNETYDNYGMTNSMKQTSDIGIFNFCGMEVIQHKFLGDVPNVNDDIRKKYLYELKNMLDKILN